LLNGLRQHLADLLGFSSVAGRHVNVVDVATGPRAKQQFEFGAECVLQFDLGRFWVVG
jgi:hypothetical protein